MASRILAQAGPSNPTSHILSRPSRVTARARARAYPSFSTSGCTSAKGPGTGTGATERETHYETLEISPGSSRMEIKAAYFRLSKRYHPDVRRSKDKHVDGEATERFHEVSTAYAVLSDDRQRRAYDRALSSTAPAPAPLSQHRSRAYGSHTPGSSSTSSYAYEMHPRRRRGATHAWESPRGYSGRMHTQYSSTGLGGGAGASASASASSSAGRYYDPSSSSSHPSSQQSSTSANTNADTNANASSQPPKREERLTGRQARAEEEHTAHDRIVHESNVGRFFRALGIILVVSWVGGLGRSLSG